MVLSLWLAGKERRLQRDPGSVLESLAHHRFIGERFCQVAPFVHQRDLLATKRPWSDHEAAGVTIMCAQRQRCGTHGRRYVGP